MRDLTDDLKASARPRGRGRDLPEGRRAAGPAPPARGRGVAARPVGRRRPGQARDGRAVGRHRRPRAVRAARGPPRRRRDAARAGPRGGRRRRRWPRSSRRWPTSTPTLRRVELRSMFSGEHDEHDALVTVQAGEGGVDAQDWAEMLLRMYTRWAERRGLRRRGRGVHRGVRGRPVVGRVRGQGPLRLRLPAGRAGRAPAGAHQPVQRPGQAADRLRRRAGRADARRRRRVGRDRRQGHQDGRLPGVRRRRPAHQQDVVGGAPHPPAHGHRRVVPGRAQPVPEPRPGDGDAARPSWPTASGPSARPSSTRSAATSSGWASAARSAATCCSRTRWSRTCAPSTRPATSPAVLDGDLDPFMEAYLQWRRSGATEARVTIRPPRPRGRVPFGTRCSGYRAVSVTSSQ